MQSVEICGKTLEEARKAAAFQLGVQEANIEIEILEEPHKILGVLGRGQYRIRATYAEKPPEEPTVLPHEPELEPEVEVEPIPEPAEAAVATVIPPGPVLEQPTDPKQAVAERAQQITGDILRLMDMPKPVTIKSVGNEQVEVEIEDDEEGSGLLIGRHGTTLDALQLVVAIAANDDIEDGCRVIVDTHGYRERHAERLRSSAHSHAAQVKQTEQELVIPDLKAYERRIIHLALRDDPDVVTYSQGQDRDRRIVISPHRRQPE